MPARDNFHLRFFPAAPYGFNVLGAEVKYENPAKHGLSAQPRLLDDDSETLEAAGFPTVEAYGQSRAQKTRMASWTMSSWTKV